MRVLHLASMHAPDDVRIFLKECRSLARAGYEVHLVAPGAPDGMRDGVAVHGFEPPAGPRPLRIARRLWRVWRAARAVRADLCHFHDPELVPVAVLLRLTGARIVYDVHEDHVATQAYEPYRLGKRLGFRVLEGIARRTCHGFVAATPAIARDFPAERTVVVRNLPLLEEFAGVRPPANGRADVVYVGGLTNPRGLREMVEAARRLRDPDARIVLIGGFGAPEVEREARALPGWEAVEHTGPLGRPAVRDRLAAARVGLALLHPERSYTESLPTKVFEYMAAGLPAVVSDFPYFRELLEPIGCATFVEPRDPEEVAAAIDGLLADKERAEEMGRRGADAVRERLNWELEAPKLLELYARLA